MQTTAFSKIVIKLQDIYQLLEMEAAKKQGKVNWLLDNYWYLFEEEDLESSHLRPSVGIMLIFILSVVRSYIVAARLQQQFSSECWGRTNLWVSKIRTL